ncbi:hypothetical protein DEJ50_18800 [Streptomyces venezuelae]|uniref:Uncharacterized protein n=1 Tax=Streptomyces venezuelae TaxID=54571 RepID=A0A5P2D640_STRVZ|nr:hypothetical protein [Streptomyces venezuelae]QES49548.1 hypothetical protein DEJ50_18800 [Streptomyces venezuelae]
MSPIAVGGPALFLGSDTPCVALLRPELDVNDAGLRLAAEQAGVSPEEFAGDAGIWQVIADRTDGEGRGFELPDLADAAAAAFAEGLLAALDGGTDFELALAGDAIAVTGRTAGDDRISLAARVVPPADAEGEGPLDLELGTLPVAELRADIADFRESLA